ncbi:NhaD family Na+:H+ antiporter [Chlamydia trachomatis]|nr:NhaD family Na+:H+ antiporter [Chlamydia trachomatis]AOQ16981.1 sodium:proton antiporter [Chlamydia trachomatis]AOQ18709.1 sodium:proton antiporter [Chlamydia trachomatis]AOQ19609.1 sodium:proton antiporter [Chlamydia trachomatis]CAX09534.1 putative membrane transport protein [Chlamydia trachomatis A2497]CAX10428.1 putative membrane transport protein [Chlamydia trachomatis B/TZ1A828/OT]
MLKFQLCLLFLFGYLAIVFEHIVRVNKSAVSLAMGGLMWLVCFSHIPHIDHVMMVEEIADMAQVIFFLFAAMAIVELIDAHRGFSIVVRCCNVESRSVLLWVLLTLSFFLSAALDNLTSIIIIISILKRLVKAREDRLLLGALCVIGVNAGGAWTPLGDVTTTMLWINDKISTSGIITTLFLPSVVCVVIAGICGQLLLKKRRCSGLSEDLDREPALPKSNLIACVGFGSLLMVPMWKAVLGVPPFMGALLGLGLVWLVSDWIHSPHGEGRNHLRMPHILTRIDISSVTFFIGILLAVNALTYSHVLRDLSVSMDALFSRNTLAVLLGLVSSVLDNVPLVAATIGMYDLPMNDPLWKLIAYTAGTGGSILIIGSAAGVAYMGMEKVSFGWYVKHASWIALASYFGGLAVYFLMENCVSLFV